MSGIVSEGEYVMARGKDTVAAGYAGSWKVQRRRFALIGGGDAGLLGA